MHTADEVHVVLQVCDGSAGGGQWRSSSLYDLRTVPDSDVEPSDDDVDDIHASPDYVNAAVDSNDETRDDVPLQPHNDVILVSDSDVQPCDRDVTHASLDDFEAAPDSDVQLRDDVTTGSRTSSKLCFKWLWNFVLNLLHCS